MKDKPDTQTKGEPEGLLRGFPQLAASAKQGELGVNIVSRIVSEKFGWLFKRNHQEHDFGIDGQIEIVTESGSVTGQMLACQIKCGKSFFRESNRWGYVYRGETKHFNYLANYPLAVIIVICDPDSKKAYWVRFRSTDAKVTESGWKLTIPYENELSTSKGALEEFLPGLTDHFSALKDYWAVNNLMFGASFIMFVIDKEEIAANDITRAKEFFKRLYATKELAYHCQGKIEISFYGYEEDPRELCEIDEVRRYVTLLDKAFPELFFFARAEHPTATLRLFLFCLMSISWEGERSRPGVPEKIIVEFDALPAFLNRHFTGLNLISEWLGLSENEIERISKAAMKALGCFPDELVR